MKVGRAQAVATIKGAQEGDLIMRDVMDRRGLHGILLRSYINVCLLLSMLDDPCRICKHVEAGRLCDVYKKSYANGL